MNSFTTAGVTHAILATRFYREVVPSLRAGALKEIGIFQSPIWKSVASQLNFGQPDRPQTPLDDDITIVLDETDRSVEEELGETASLFFTAPTRFALIYFDCVLKHSAAVKRDRMGANAPRKLNSFANHDVEGDIAWVTEEARKARELHFSLYEKFATSVANQDFTSAKHMLFALQAIRANWPEEFQQEMAGWEIQIACEIGDVTMFVKGWNTLWKDATVNTDLLLLLLQKLFYSAFANGVLISLNALGLTEATKHGGYQAFCDIQSGIFLNGLLTSIGEELLRDETFEAISFCDMVRILARQKKESFKSLNPYIAVIGVSWK